MYCSQPWCDIPLGYLSKTSTLIAAGQIEISIFGYTQDINCYIWFMSHYQKVYLVIYSGERQKNLNESCHSTEIHFCNIFFCSFLKCCVSNYFSFVVLFVEDS